MVLQNQLSVRRSDLVLRGHPLQAIQAQYLVVIVLLHVRNRYLLRVLLVVLVLLLRRFLLICSLTRIITTNNRIRRSILILFPSDLHEIRATASLVRCLFKEAYSSHSRAQSANWEQ